MWIAGWGQWETAEEPDHLEHREVQLWLPVGATHVQQEEGDGHHWAHDWRSGEWEASKL